MNAKIKELVKQCTSWSEGSTWTSREELDPEAFAKLIIEECISVITNYEIPVGNSRAGEIACDMTYRALVDIRQQIRHKFGVQR